MTSKVIAVEFVLPTALAVVLGGVLSVGAVYLFDYLLTRLFPYSAHKPSRAGFVCLVEFGLKAK
jgi:hypothetical protein